MIYSKAVVYLGTDVTQNLMILDYAVAELFDSLAGRTHFMHFCAVFNWQYFLKTLLGQLIEVLRQLWDSCP